MRDDLGERMAPGFRMVGLTTALLGGPVLAQSSTVGESASSFTFTLNGAELTITRDGAGCPSSCIQPIAVAGDVRTLGELELIAFLQDTVSSGTGLVIDVRMPDRFAGGSIPGAVNVPVATFAPDNPYRGDLLSALGVTNPGGSPDFARAFSLVLFGNGPDDPAAPDAIASLLDAGYPPDKIHYYRGGAADWTTLGLNLAVTR